MKNIEKKLIVILGQTASGKTNLSLALAKKFGGEIVSADSRQVYKGLNVGSGKIIKNTGHPLPTQFLYSREYKNNILQLGIKKSPDELKILIRKRLQKRIKSIIAEVKKLRKSCLYFNRLEEFRLEYRFVAQYLQN